MFLFCNVVSVQTIRLSELFRLLKYFYLYIPLLFHFVIIVDRKLWFVKRIRVMYDKWKVYAGTEEFQFEEIRAAKYMAIVKRGLPLPKDVNRSKKAKKPSCTGREKRTRHVSEGQSVRL